MRLEHRLPRFLHLQEQRIERTPPFEQDDGAARADAAHADDLLRDVAEVVLVDEEAAVVGQRLAVLPVELVDLRFEHRVRVEVDDERRSLDDATAAVDVTRELREGLLRRVGTAPRREDAQRVRVHGIRRVEDREIHVRVRVVDLERRQRHEPPHLDRVPQCGRARGTRIDIASPDRPGGHRAARGQPLHVPLPRRGQGFVEVVDVEGEAAVGCRVRAEVQEMRVAARLHVDAGLRGPREIPRHHHRRAPEEREVGLEHPRVAHGHEIGQAPAVRLLEQVDRIRPVGRQIELGVTGSRHAPAQLATRVDQVRARVMPLRSLIVATGFVRAAPDSATVMERNRTFRPTASRQDEANEATVIARWSSNPTRCWPAVSRTRVSSCGRVTRCTGPRTCTRRRSTVSCRRSPPPASTARPSRWASKPAASDSCSSPVTCRCRRIRSGPSRTPRSRRSLGCCGDSTTASRGFDPSASTWSTEMQDPVGATTTGAVMCHNDVCLENVVFRAGNAVALLDFDFAAPGRPIYDLAQMARMCVPIDDDTNAARLGWEPGDRPRRLRLVADEYGLDGAGRAELLEILSMSIARGGEFVRRRVEAGDPNFVRMWDEMGGAARFERRREWFNEQREQFVNALR